MTDMVSVAMVIVEISHMLEFSVFCDSAHI